jgi:hypothetical protein
MSGITFTTRQHEAGSLRVLATAQAASYGVATTAESTPENPGVPWATVYLLELAGDLHASIHSGLRQAQGGGL